MKQKLPWSELQEWKYLLSEMNEGETRHYNHCKQGRDNARFYITRTSDGLVCYCHHCGASGFLGDTYAAVRKASSVRRENGNSTSKLVLPTDCTGNTSEWSGAARLWVRRAGITDEECRDRGLTYSKQYGRVYIPIYLGGDLVGYLGRAIESEGPKYYAMRSNTDTFFYHLRKEDDVCIIVEDCLSAIKCFRHGSAFAMLGTSLTDSALMELVKHHKRFIVATDWDNPTVKLKHAELCNRLSLFGKVKSVHVDRDPKLMNDTMIKEMLQ